MRRFLVNSLAALLAAIPLEAISQVTTPGKIVVTPPSSSVDLSQGASRPDDEEVASQTLSPIVVTATRPTDSSPSVSRRGKRDLAQQRATTSDSARLLQDIPGVSLYGAGGISSLPAIHGLADDRLRVQVDGMDLMSACPNHMNSTLSYINPTDVANVTVFAGITPVSAGGDSIGGTIQVKSAPPVFANADEGILAKGQLGAFHRSNGNAHGHNLGATLAGQNVSLSYSESKSQSDNYTAAENFKPSSTWSGFQQNGLKKTAANEVGSSSYKDSKNRNLGLALRHNSHLLELNVAEQTVGFEGFPNQRMDMTANKNTLANVRYTGQFPWGELEAGLFGQDTRHEMEMSLERAYGLPAMPMNSKAKTRGAQIKGSIEFSERDTFKVGSEYQTYRLDDWWPPLGNAPGSMCCDNFWNVRNGERDRTGFFGEWEARWNPEWLSLLGIRGDTVKANAGLAQGYSQLLMYTRDANPFNALDHGRTDHNVDLTALARYTPDETRTYEIGYARKSRSANLYERYPWSASSMAALMNNFVGDGNGYIGNLDLKPEVANTFAATGDWHDAESEKWGLKLTGYHTYVRDFIDARRCNFNNAASCGATNLPPNTGAFVLLQYVNQSARLHGIDLSGHWLLGRTGDYGSFDATGVLNYVRGENRTTGDNLYHMMPLNAKLAMVHRLGSWTSTAEVQLVAIKKHVSQVRNEVPTKGYGLFNVRSSYEWKHARLDVGIENLFNRFYLMPLGGAYLGQGWSMTPGAIPWGYTVPGMGRSANVALNVHF